MERQKINCTVYNCKHCDINRNNCRLDQINVVNHNADNPKEATVCDSFKER